MLAASALDFVCCSQCCDMHSRFVAVLLDSMSVSCFLMLQVAYHASRALLQYVRAHLVSHMTSLQRRLRDAQVSAANGLTQS